MNNFRLTTHQYRNRLEKDYERRLGYISDMHRQEIENQVREYAERRRREKLGDFNVLTDDPGCKSCGKKGKKNDKRRHDT